MLWVMLLKHSSKLCSKMELLWTFLVRHVFYCIRWAVNILQALLHFINGVHRQRAQVHDYGCLTDSEAEVFTVIGRNSSAMLVGLQDDSYFMLWHKKFESLEYLLTSDVSLYAIDSNYAYFVKIPKGIDIFNTEDHPFMFKAQQDHAEEVIVITIDKLLRLSKRLRKPSCCLTFLVHSTRCGSTALCQMFNALPGWRAIAETAFPVKYLYDMRYKPDRSVTDLAYCDKFYDVAEACIRIYVKDFEPQLNVLFKTIGIMEFFMIPFISKRFPESHIISAHRSGLGTAKSSYQVFYDMVLNMVLPTIWNRLVSYNLFWGDVSRIILLMSSGMGEEFERHLMSGQYRDSFYLHYVRWITNSLLYLKYYGDANPGKLTCVNFEDLMSDKQGTLSQIMKALDIPKEHMHFALQGLDFDSQKHSVVGHAARQKKPVWVYNQTTVDQVQDLLDKYGLPKFDQKFRFCSKEGYRIIE